MNKIFYALVAIAFVYAAIAHISWRSPETEDDGSATVLSDGRVLVVSMSGAITWNGQAYKLAKWADIDPPSTMRRDAVLAPLPDGDALLVGGRSQTRGYLQWLGLRFGRESLEVTDQVERWDAQTGDWTSVAPLPEPATEMVLRVADDGSIVLIGGLGQSGEALDVVWRFEPKGGVWSALPSMPEGRAGHAVGRLPDGDLLVVGGITSEGTAALEALRLDTTTVTWSKVAGPRLGRLDHSVVDLEDGVLAVGGRAPDLGPVQTTEIFDPMTETWRSAGTFPSGSASKDRAGRLDPTVVALPDGRVIAAAGRDAEGNALRSVVIRSVDGVWAPGITLDEARAGGLGLAVGGKAVLIGGGSGALIYRGDLDAWMPSWPDSPMGKVGDAMLTRATQAVMEIVLPLIGGMTLFLGAMKVAEAGGLMTVLAKLIRPIMVFLFPDVPPDHPAMGAMILNMSANALGLGNAATPFGIRAMEQLDSINPHKGTATNAMALFLAINTSNVTILPTGVIVLRAINGSSEPGGILITTLFATICSTTVAVIAAKLYQRFVPTVAEAAAAAQDDDDAVAPEAKDVADEPGADAEALPEAASEAYPWWVSAIAIALLLSVVPLAVLPYTRSWITAVIPWIIPTLIAGLLTYGFAKGVPVYEAFVAGAKDGWTVAVKIIPFVVGILVVIAMLKGSGAMEAFTGLVGPFTGMLGLPAEALPMALLRPLSGSGAMGVMIDTISDPAVGPDSYTGYLVSTFQGSTETTFYVLAVYYGAVGIKRVRHSLAAALTADAAGVIAAIVICTIVFALK